MEENQENVTPNPEPAVEATPEPAAEPSTPAVADLAAQLTQGLAKREGRPPRPEQQPQVREPREQQPKREGRPERGPRPEKGAGRPGGDRPAGDRGPRPGGDRGPRPGGGERREGGRPSGGDRGGRSFEPMMDIDIEKLMTDSLYLDNQAHAVVVRMRDMDSGTKSQLRRLFNAVRRAVRAPESDRQHQFVMLRARLAYTIARHSLRSLDGLERLLLQVTRKNNAQGYERFKDLFEAIVAYNE
jgi:CRISPR type III-A-associated protein Csm2